MTSSSRPSQDSGEFDIVGIVQQLWRSRWLIVSITALFSAGGIAYVLLATEWYEARVVLVQEDTSSLPLGLSQLSGLASIAGVSLGAGGQDQEPLAMLRSREFAAEFIEKQGLIPVFFADKWDAGRKAWKSANPDDHPDIRDAVRYFDKKVRGVSVDEKTGLVTLGITWKQPEEGARWANIMAAEVNGRLRQRAMLEAEGNIKYLNEAITESRILSLQQPLVEVLKGELQKYVLARGRVEFAFKVVDRATPAKYRSKPKRALICVLAALLGAGIATLIVLVRHTATFRKPA